MAYGYKFNASQNESVFVGIGAGGIMRYAELTPFSAYTNELSTSPTTSDINGVVSNLSGSTREVVIVCQDGSAYSTINGGITWRTETTGTANALYSVMWSPTYSAYYASGAGGTILRRSFNTTSWTSVNTSAPAVAINKIYDFGGTLVGCASGTGTSIIQSANGTSWSGAGTLSASDGAMVTNMAWSGSVYLAATDTAMYSNTALSGTWTQRAAGTAPFSVHYSSQTGEFYAHSWVPTSGLSTGAVGYSANGTTWYNRTHSLVRTLTGDIRQALLDENGYPYFVTELGYAIYAAAPNSALSRLVNTPEGVNTANTGNGRHCGVGIARLGTRVRNITLDSDSVVPGLWCARTWASDSTAASPYTVAYDGTSQFVTSGGIGTMMRSSDGISWTRGTSGALNPQYSGTIAAVAWSPLLSKFVGVGGDSTEARRFFTSTNGLNWTASYIGGGTNLFHVACSSTRTVLASQIGHILTNTGGTYFDNNTVTSITGNAIVDSLTYLNGKFFLTTAGKILYSTDAVTWTEATISPSVTGSIGAIDWNGTRYVCFANNTAAAGTNNNTANYVLTSTNGISWTSSAPGSPIVGTDFMKGVAWSSALNLFAAISNGGKIFTSSTGLANSWTQQTSNAETPYYVSNTSYWGLYRVYWTGSQFTVTGDGAQVITSPDGITWTRRSIITATFQNVYIPVSVLIRPYSQSGPSSLYGRTLKYTLEHDQTTGIGRVSVINAGAADILVLGV